jgi:hypothetical protein
MINGFTKCRITNCKGFVGLCTDLALPSVGAMNEHEEIYTFNRCGLGRPANCFTKVSLRHEYGGMAYL